MADPSKVIVTAGTLYGLVFNIHQSENHAHAFVNCDDRRCKLAGDFRRELEAYNFCEAMEQREKDGLLMPCANCGRTYEEHRDGSAYRDFTGAGAECNEYAESEPMCKRCGVASFACECGEEESHG